MVAHALAHDRGTGVADAEALAGKAVDEALARRGAVEGNVADCHILVELERHRCRRSHRQDAAGEALAEVVVRIARDVERDARRQECAEGLTARALAVNRDRALRQALGMLCRHGRAEHRTDTAVHVRDVRMEVDRTKRFPGRLRVRDEERGVERLGEP